MRDVRHMQQRVEVRLDRVQVVWLTLGGVIAMGLMFALGTVVGRRAERLALQKPAPSSIAQINADSSVQKELTFYSKLTAPDATPAQGVTTEARRAQAPAASHVAQQGARDTAKTREAALAAGQSAASEQTSVAAAVARLRREATTPRPAESAIRRQLAAGPARAGDYTVQVSSFQSSPEAEAFAAGLERKGYKPFIVRAYIPGKGTWYRVRLGRFDSQSNAESAKLVLARSDIPAWVLRN